MLPLPHAVAGFLGKPGDPDIVALAETHLEVVTAYVRAYVRGNGFNDDGLPSEALAAVIIAATARLVRNPTLARQRSQTAGQFTQLETPGVLDGFTLPELSVLHLYRRRTA